MTTNNSYNRAARSASVIFTELPGPTRKRLTSPYCYRMTHRADNTREPGCVLMWDVMGGREIYQIALERLNDGGLHWHCTCADAVYRGDGRHTCKHVKGLIEQGRARREAEATA